MQPRMPEYEIWGGRCDSQSDWDGDERHLEDCLTLAEARVAQKGWQDAGYFACIRNKNTGDNVL